VYDHRDDILADSRRPGGASRDIRLTDNTYVILRGLGFADSSKRLKPASTRGRISSSDWRTISAWQSITKQSSRPVPKIDDCP
jgi:hypothetical protein